MEIKPIFYNFICSDFLSIDNSALEEYCIRQKKSNSGRIISNQGGWQSNDLDFTAPELAPLLFEISVRLNKLHKELQLINSSVQVIDNMWANINSPGSYNLLHLHPASCFSGVYYIKGNEKSGSIRFRNPNLPIEYVLGPKYIQEYNGFNSASWKIFPEPGKLLIFPSWLLHDVSPNQDDTDRFSISFNSVMRPA
jgi:uncharacterized protein (TIGR02466 family)